MAAGTNEIETEIGALTGRGEHAAAATLLIRHYGSDIMRFLIAVTRDFGEADEAFAEFCLQLWQGMAGFRGECSFRTWVYVLARGALGRVHAQRGRRRAEVALSEEAMDIVRSVRTHTPAYLRSEAKDRLSQVRAGLERDDQMLLILRINRGLSWSEVARILAGPDASDDTTDLPRQAAALRKRFERLKEKLRAELGR